MHATKISQLARYTGTNAPTYNFPAVFSRVLLPAATEDVLRSKQKYLLSLVNRSRYFF